MHAVVATELDELASVTEAVGIVPIHKQHHDEGKEGVCPVRLVIRVGSVRATV